MIPQTSGQPPTAAMSGAAFTASPADQVKVDSWVRLLREWDKSDLAARDAVVHDVYTLYRGRVLAMAIGELRKRGYVSRDEVEDVVQETFAALLGYIHKHPRKFASGLGEYGIGGLVRLLQTIVRQQVGRRTQANRKAGELDALGLIEDWTASDESESGLQAATNAIWARQVLDQLPGNERSLLVRRYLEGKSFQEIAEATGTTVAATKMRMSRLMTELRARIPNLEA